MHVIIYRLLAQYFDSASVEDVTQLCTDHGELATMHPAHKHVKTRIVEYHVVIVTVGLHITEDMVHFRIGQLKDVSAPSVPMLWVNCVGATVLSCV